MIRVERRCQVKFLITCVVAVVVLMAVGIIGTIRSSHQAPAVAYAPPPMTTFVPLPAFCGKERGPVGPAEEDFCVKYPAARAAWEGANPGLVEQARKRAAWEAAQK